MNKIIAICGFKGSGKDTVAKLLETCYTNANHKDCKVERLAYADPIKETVMNIFHLKDVSEYDAFKRDEFKVNDQVSVKGRDIVVGIGMKMREYDENQFVCYVASKINSDNINVAIITDLRFQNEVNWCKTNHAFIVKVINPATHSENHVTERGISDENCDCIIRNDGDMETLKGKVAQLYNLIEGKTVEL